ncbi:hypothetical protein BC937DRAFT_89648 [Endogone sp. FLAS-F59071]|nr:hypothetical protein BC937DRAFT_89648 [Endogone sp. FLAS-F59071]|eukprot:RUS17670.1 hypothetical protein BC937DRAFT_89648 [Endogone sp. FLAS-F59071]
MANYHPVMSETVDPTFRDILNLLEQSHTREMQEHTGRANHLQSELTDLKALFKKLQDDYMKLFIQYNMLKDRYNAQKTMHSKHTGDGSERLSGEKSSTGAPVQKERQEKPEIRKYEGSDETGVMVELNGTWQSGGELARTGDVALVPVYAAAVTFDAASRPTEPVVEEEPIESSGLCSVHPTSVAASSLSPHQPLAFSTSTHQAGLPVLAPASPTWAKQGVTAELGLKLPKNRSRCTHSAVSSTRVVKEVGGADKEPVGGAGRDEVVIGDKDAMEEIDETEMRQEEKVDEGKEKAGERGEETQPISSPTLDESEVCPVSQTFPSRFILVNDDDDNNNNDKNDDNDDNGPSEEASGSDDDVRNAKNLSTQSTAPFDERPRTGQLRNGMSSPKTDGGGLDSSSPTGAKLDVNNPFDVIRATASLSQLTQFTRKLKASTIVPSSSDFNRTQAEMADEWIWSEAGGWSRKHPRSIGGLGDGVKADRVAPRRSSSPVEKERHETEDDDDNSTEYSLSRHDDDISIVYGTTPDSFSCHDDGNEVFWNVSIGNKRKTLEPDETERRMGNGKAEPSKIETPRRRKKWREEADAHSGGEMSEGSSQEILQSPSKVQMTVTTPSSVSCSAKHIDNNSFHNKPLTPTSCSPTKTKAHLNTSSFAGGTLSGSPTLPAPSSAFIPPRRVNFTPDNAVNMGMSLATGSAESTMASEDQPLRWLRAQKRHREADARVTETPAEKVPKFLRMDDRISGALNKGKQRDVHSHDQERRFKDYDDDDDWEGLLTMDTEYKLKRDTRRGGNVMEAEAAGAHVWGSVATNAVDEQAGVTLGLGRARAKDGVLSSNARDTRSYLTDANDLGSEVTRVRNADYPDARTTIVLSDGEDGGEKSRKSRRNVVTSTPPGMINSKKNGGVNYKYTEVVRKKDERSRMHGADCPCCRKFYAATGPLRPVDGHGPRFRSASPVDQNALPTDEDLLQRRIDQVSRHKYVHRPPASPPGYWMVDFPNSQQIKKWNEGAREKE